MAFTSKLGSSDSKPGNIVPAYGAGIADILKQTTLLQDEAFYTPTIKNDVLFIGYDDWSTYGTWTGGAFPSYAPYTGYYNSFWNLVSVSAPPWNPGGSGYLFRLNLSGQNVSNNPGTGIY